MTATATTSEELRRIGGLVHDAHFDWELIVFDPAEGVVTIPFEQEADEDDPPGPQVPFFRCTATIRRATACRIGVRDRDDPGMLNIMEPDDAADEIVLVPVTGPEVRVAVDAIDVRIEMTDEVAFHVRRRRRR